MAAVSSGGERALPVLGGLLSVLAAVLVLGWQADREPMTPRQVERARPTVQVNAVSADAWATWTTAAGGVLDRAGSQVWSRWRWLLVDADEVEQTPEPVLDEHGQLDRGEAVLKEPASVPEKPPVGACASERGRPPCEAVLERSARCSGHVAVRPSDVRSVRAAETRCRANIDRAVLSGAVCRSSDRHPGRCCPLQLQTDANHGVLAMFSTAGGNNVRLAGTIAGNQLRLAMFEGNGPYYMIVEVAGDQLTGTWVSVFGDKSFPVTFTGTLGADFALQAASKIVDEDSAFAIGDVDLSAC